MAANDDNRTRSQSGFTTSTPYVTGPPRAQTFGVVRPLVALIWMTANLVLIVAAVSVAYFVAIRVLVGDGEYRLQEWGAVAGGRVLRVLLGACALALILYPLNAFVFGWVNHPERTHAPRFFAIALVALVVLAATVGALQSLYIHVVYSAPAV